MDIKEDYAREKDLMKLGIGAILSRHMSFVLGLNKGSGALL